MRSDQPQRPRNCELASLNFKTGPFPPRQEADYDVHTWKRRIGNYTENPDRSLVFDDTLVEGAEKEELERCIMP